MGGKEFDQILRVGGFLLTDLAGFFAKTGLSSSKTGQQAEGSLARAWSRRDLGLPHEELNVGAGEEVRSQLGGCPRQLGVPSRNDSGTVKVVLKGIHRHLS